MFKKLWIQKNKNIYKIEIPQYINTLKKRGCSMSYDPIPGDRIFNAIRDKPHIVMACNTRITKGIARGIFRAAQKMDAAVLFELAISECNHETGYTGFRPRDFSERIRQAADEVGHDIWALHADHLKVKTGDVNEIEYVKRTIKEQIDSGFTSFAIDASHLFNFDGKNVDEELFPNIAATERLVDFIKENRKEHFGLEVEVGEIGRVNNEGLILTNPDEAVAFIKALNKKNIFPQLLAIANGSSHGNTYDHEGHLIEQTTIDIERTRQIAKALRENGIDTRIAQHGTTGTPLNFIATRFPHGDIMKANVGTIWQNLFYEVLKIYEPGLYDEIWEWTMKNFREEAKRKGVKSDLELFGRYGKSATRVFFDRIYNLSESVEHALESAAYAEALFFFKAFRSQGTASLVRKTR